MSLAFIEFVDGVSRWCCSAGWKTCASIGIGPSSQPCTIHVGSIEINRCWLEQVAAPMVNPVDGCQASSRCFVLSSRSKCTEVVVGVGVTVAVSVMTQTTVTIGNVRSNFEEFCTSAGYNARTDDVARLVDFCNDVNGPVGKHGFCKTTVVDHCGTGCVNIASCTVRVSTIVTVLVNLNGRMSAFELYAR